MSKLTDKERLDWVERTGMGPHKGLGFLVWRLLFSWWVIPWQRTEIDAAIAAEKAGTKRRGK